MSEIGLIPSGYLEGLPCVRLRFPGATEPDHLYREYKRVWYANIRALWLEADNWSSRALDNNVTYLLSQPETSHLVVWAKRSVSDRDWMSTQTWNSVDASAVMDVPHTMASLQMELGKQPITPQPSELVLRNPHMDNLLPSVLDSLAMRWGAPMGWIYLKNPEPWEWDRASQACAAASSQWGLRK